MPNPSFQYESVKTVTRHCNCYSFSVLIFDSFRDVHVCWICANWQTQNLSAYCILFVQKNRINNNNVVIIDGETKEDEKAKNAITIGIFSSLELFFRHHFDKFRHAIKWLMTCIHFGVNIAKLANLLISILTPFFNHYYYVIAITTSTV